MERTKHGLFVFPPKKTLIWRRHCSIDQSCCSMTSKQFLESSSGMKFVYPSVRLANQKPGAFVSVRYTNQIALFPFVCCFCFVHAFSFQGHTKIALLSLMVFDSRIDTEVMDMNKRQTSPQTTFMLLYRAKKMRAKFTLFHLLFPSKSAVVTQVKNQFSATNSKWITVQLNCVHAS